MYSEKLVAIYQYKDLKGNVIHETLRYSPKRFIQRQPDGRGGYIYNLDGVYLVLFRLTEITDAIREGREIWLCEGEKDALNLVKIGLQATTCAQGAGKWRKSYTDTLRHSEVVILPDKDNAGLKAAVDVADELIQAGIIVRIIRLPGKGKDVSDWLDAGNNKNDLYMLYFETPPYVSIPKPRQKSGWRQLMYEACDMELYFWLMIIKERQFAGDYEALTALKYELKRRAELPKVKPGQEKYLKALK